MALTAFIVGGVAIVIVTLHLDKIMMPPPVGVRSYMQVRASIDIGVNPFMGQGERGYRWLGSPDGTTPDATCTNDIKFRHHKHHWKHQHVLVAG